MIETLVLFGATGDLAGRFLLPAIASLQAAGKLPDGFTVVGVAREDLGEDAFQEAAREGLAEHAADVPEVSREAVVRALRYRPADVTDADRVASLVAAGHGPVAAYLALPPRLFPAAVRALAMAGLEPGSRIVVEKPFGEDLESATELNRLLAETLGPTAEQTVFRVDHVLGMATVQNLLALRQPDSFLDAVWNGDHVDRVEILWEETLALEGRAGYYDGTGALEDVLQNHMLQILGLLAMEPLARPDEQDLHDRKLDLLRSVMPLTRADAAQRTRRARYTAGRLANGTAVPSYADEVGVEPERATETFAEVMLELDAERWAGTCFMLRAGKALSRRRKLAVVRFRTGEELRVGVDGPEDVNLELGGGQLVLSAPPPASELPAYGRVLLDVLDGGTTLSVGRDEAEESWRVVTPVLEAWSEGLVPLQEYPAGSDGPS